MKQIFTPYARVSSSKMMLASVLTTAIIVGLWVFMPNKLLPSPLEVWHQFQYLVTERGLFHETWVSLKLNLEATFIAALMAMALAYIQVIPATRPFVSIFENWRYAPVIGLTFYFLVIFDDAHTAKVAVIVFAMLPFILTSLADSVRCVEEDALNHARTLKLGHLGTTWEVVIYGRRENIIESIRQSFPIGWGMTPFVEGFIRTEGGVGLMIVEQAKYLKLADLFAVMLFILALGLLQNKLLHWLRDTVSPYAKIGKGAL